MSHIFFFSYARGDRRDRGDRGDQDSYLDEFFKDLCTEVAAPTKFESFDPEVSFRDTKDLPLMENWKTNILNALQSSAVMVCVTSEKYFNSTFCGKEYYIFDQRRRQGVAAGADPPGNVLSVVWHPVEGGLPEFMKDAQLVPDGVSDTYLKRGLRHLKRFDRAAYEMCVAGFATAIREKWRQHAKIKPLAQVEEFEDIPNQFSGGDWREAADPAGWKRGPEVANFIFVAETKDDAIGPAEKCGNQPSEWRPYLPPEITTILEFAKKAKKKQFLLREIPVSDGLAAELKRAKERLNLSLIVASHNALVLDRFQEIRHVEDLWWDGTALLIPCDDPTVDEATVRQSLQKTMPRLSVLSHEKNVVLPIRTHTELIAKIEGTLNAMCQAVKNPEIDKRESKDLPPPSVSGVNP